MVGRTGLLPLSAARGRTAAATKSAIEEEPTRQRGRIEFLQEKKAGGGGHPTAMTSTRTRAQCTRSIACHRRAKIGLGGEGVGGGEGVQQHGGGGQAGTREAIVRAEAEAHNAYERSC